MIPDEQNKLRVKLWLKQHRRDRNWLARACNVSKRTVDNWLSTPLPLPGKTLRLLEQIMSNAHPENSTPYTLPIPPRSPSPSQIFSIEIDLDRFRAYSKAALAEGLTLEEWVMKTLSASTSGPIPAKRMTNK
jgi:hypothetical protein